MCFCGFHFVERNSAVFYRAMTKKSFIRLMCPSCTQCKKVTTTTWKRHFFGGDHNHRNDDAWRLLEPALMALIGSGAYGANLAKLMWNHVHKCFWMAKYRKPKSFKQPFFDWIKITDFLIAKLIIFWEWKMTPKNSQFCYKKICNFDPIKKGLTYWFCFWCTNAYGS